MAETLTALDGLLKDVYSDVIREQISTFDDVQEVFEKQAAEDIQWEGRQAIECSVMSYNEGVGAIAENANLPTAGNFDPQNFKIPMRYLYGSFEMTKQMMESAKTSKGAFKNATKTSFETLVKNMKRERARMLWGYGGGILALVNGAVSASTTVTVDAPGNIAGATGGARFLRKGQIIVISNDGTAVTAVRTITAVAAAGTSITVDSSMSCDDNARIYKISTASSSAMTDSGNAKEPMGLLGMVDDGTYVGTFHNLSRTTYPQLKSRVESSVGALSLDALQRNFDVASQLGDGEISHLACHHAVRRAYLTLLEADRRYSGADLKSPDGGTKAVKRGQYVTFGDIPIIESRNAPYGSMFGLDKSTFRRYVQVDGEWADDSGAILRQTSGKDTWNAFYRLWENYHCGRPNANFRMDGITASSIYVASY